MHEVLLKRFFVGEATASELTKDLSGAVQRDRGVLRFHIEDMDGEFRVDIPHLVRVCEAVLAGSLPIDSLEPLGFCVVASDAFCWDVDTQDGDVVSEVLLQWAAPMANMPLTRGNVERWHRRLQGEEISDWEYS